jgi:hypothetical protein
MISATSVSWTSSMKAASSIYPAGRVKPFWRPGADGQGHLAPTAAPHQDAPRSRHGERPMGRKPLTAEQRERRRAYLKAWRAEHREHCIAYDKRQRQKCREQRRADNVRWYETHREQVLARRKCYYQNNRERINQERKKRRRAQKHAAGEPDVGNSNRRDLD